MSEVEILTVKQTAAALQVTTKTIWRLIKRGELPAFKLAHQWRVRRQDLEKFIRERLTYYGLRAVKPHFYQSIVLDKYRSNPKKYYLHDEAFGGKLGRREHLHKQLRGYKPSSLDPPLFCEVRYHKVTLSGALAVVLRPSEFDKITSSPEEQNHWIKLRILKPGF